MTASARVLVPITITNAMILAGTTIAEPASGETLWVSAATYAVGQEVIRSTTHRVYTCGVAHTGRTGLPEVDTAYWADSRPTQRWCPFDDYANTKTSTVTGFTFVLQPGFCNGLVIYGLLGTNYALTVKDAPGGTVTKSETGDLYAQAGGFYELLYTILPVRTQLSFDDLAISPTTEVTITITSGTGLPVALGTVKVGDWRQFKGDGKFGGAEYGAQSARTSYTFRRYELDGTYKTVKRPTSRDVTVTINIEADQAMYADSILSEIADTAVPFEAVGLEKYGYLNTLGFVTGSMRAGNPGITNLNLTIKGNV